MKKNSLKKLRISKKVIANFDTEKIVGGATGDVCWKSKKICPSKHCHRD